MVGERYRKISTQKEFLKAASGQFVTYEASGVFRTDDAEITVSKHRVGEFAAKLGKTMTFDAYDRLTRQIWVAHMRSPSEPEIF